MKLQHYQDYTQEDTARSESALLTVWAALQDLTDDMVLVGGLVPRYICRRSFALQPVTMDVDLAVDLGISSGLYDTTKTRLINAGFEWKEKRFVKQLGNISVFLDLLTDKPDANAPDSAMVDDVPVSAIFGVSRALTLYRKIVLSGKDLYGANFTETVKVCEVGPFICLKLQAYKNRAQSKDVFDFVRTLRDYDGGTAAAVAAFLAEQHGNLAFEGAVETLRERFKDANAKGPVQYADFCTGGLSPETSGDAAYIREQYANEAVDAAFALITAVKTGAAP